jgi:hypothetical protein
VKFNRVWCVESKAWESTGEPEASVSRLYTTAEAMRGWPENLQEMKNVGHRVKHSELHTR